MCACLDQELSAFSAIDGIPLLVSTTVAISKLHFSVVIEAIDWGQAHARLLVDNLAVVVVLPDVRSISLALSDFKVKASNAEAITFG